MIGIDSFCPKSGAALTRDRHYDDSGRAKRAVTATEGSSAAGTVGELTNGEVRSARTALLTYFERCHRRHGDPDAELYRRASVALRRLKSVASGRQAWDVHVWFALRRRLASLGYEVAWMDSHASLRCPRCHSRLRYQSVDGGAVTAHCGVDCADRPGDALSEIRDTLAALYASAFEGDAQPAETFLRFED